MRPDAEPDSGHAEPGSNLVCMGLGFYLAHTGPGLGLRLGSRHDLVCRAGTSCRIGLCLCTSPMLDQAHRPILCTGLSLQTAPLIQPAAQKS